MHELYNLAVLRRWKQSFPKVQNLLNLILETAQILITRKMANWVYSDNRMQFQKLKKNYTGEWEILKTLWSNEAPYKNVHPIYVKFYSRQNQGGKTPEPHIKLLHTNKKRGTDEQWTLWLVPNRLVKYTDFRNVIWTVSWPLSCFYYSTCRWCRLGEQTLKYPV